MNKDDNFFNEKVIKNEKYELKDMENVIQDFNEVIINLKRSIKLMNIINEHKSKIDEHTSKKNKIINIFNEAHLELEAYIHQDKNALISAFKDKANHDRFFMVKDNLLNLLQDLEDEQEIQKCKFNIQCMRIIEDRLKVMEL